MTRPYQDIVIFLTLLKLVLNPLKLVLVIDDGDIILILRTGMLPISYSPYNMAFLSERDPNGLGQAARIGFENHLEESSWKVIPKHFGGTAVSQTHALSWLYAK